MKFVRECRCLLPNQRHCGHNIGMEKVARKFSSYAESERADREYYRSLTPQQRVDIVLELVARTQTDETDQGFARVYRVVKRHKS